VSAPAQAAHHRAGALASGQWALSLDAWTAGWSFAGLRILELPEGGGHTFATADDEVLVLPLAGNCVIECEQSTFELAGRADVFSGTTDFAYLPSGATATVTSRGGGRFAFPSARARRRLAPRYVPAADVPVELRGAGACSRQVNNFCTPGVLDADRLIACEVLTPGGNWSSYPPHKHDEDRPGEAVLEEIYYYEVSPGPQGPGLGYQRVYGTPERPADVLAEVRTGDVVTIPHGWHGPSMAAPGYDLYYLNVMAGPAEERAWLISDDPDHAWVRDGWASQQVDSRLPLTGERPRT
jgi:5-deoxy-glucuronate isomerase